MPTCDLAFSLCNSPIAPAVLFGAKRLEPITLAATRPMFATVLDSSDEQSGLERRGGLSNY